MKEFVSYERCLFNNQILISYTLLIYSTKWREKDMPSHRQISTCALIDPQMSPNSLRRRHPSLFWSGWWARAKNWSLPHRSKTSNRRSPLQRNSRRESFSSRLASCTVSINLAVLRQLIRGLLPSSQTLRPTCGSWITQTTSCRQRRRSLVWEPRQHGRKSRAKPIFLNKLSLRAIASTVHPSTILRQRTPMITKWPLAAMRSLHSRSEITRAVHRQNSSKRT